MTGLLPGPWRVRRLQAETGDYAVILDSANDTVVDIPRWDDCYAGQMDASARLIAAAPDLLAALRGLVEAETAYQRGGGASAAFRIASYLLRARAAIANATGGDK